MAKNFALTVFISTEDSFTAHAKLADFAAEYLFKEMGEFGFGSRAAMATAWLPSDAPVEIQLVAAIASINDYREPNLL